MLSTWILLHRESPRTLHVSDIIKCTVPCHTNISNSMASHVMSCHALRCHDGHAPQRHAVGVSSNYRDSMMYITWHNLSVLQATQKNEMKVVDKPGAYPCKYIVRHFIFTILGIFCKGTNTLIGQMLEDPRMRSVPERHQLGYHWSPMVGTVGDCYISGSPRVIDLHLLQSCIHMCPWLGTPTPEKNGCLPCPP